MHACKVELNVYHGWTNELNCEQRSHRTLLEKMSERTMIRQLMMITCFILTCFC